MTEIRKVLGLCIDFSFKWTLGSAIIFYTAAFFAYFAFKFDLDLCLSFANLLTFSNAVSALISSFVICLPHLIKENE